MKKRIMAGKYINILLAGLLTILLLSLLDDRVPVRASEWRSY